MFGQSLRTCSAHAAVRHSCARLHRVPATFREKQLNLRNDPTHAAHRLDDDIDMQRIPKRPFVDLTGSLEHVPARNYSHNAVASIPVTVQAQSAEHHGILDEMEEFMRTAAVWLRSENSIWARVTFNSSHTVAASESAGLSTCISISD